MTELEEFGKAVFDELKEHCVNGEFEVDLELLLGIAAKHGLAEQVEYDPKKHGKELSEDFEPGDTIWYWGKK